MLAATTAIGCGPPAGGAPEINDWTMWTALAPSMTRARASTAIPDPTESRTPIWIQVLPGRRCWSARVRDGSPLGAPRARAAETCRDPWVTGLLVHVVHIRFLRGRGLGDYSRV